MSVLRRAALCFVATFMIVPNFPVLMAGPTPVAENVLYLGSIQALTVTESSGVIASRNYPGAFWTHNDGNEYLISMTKRGATLGGYYVNGVRFLDWEDIAIDGLGNLYLADIGDDGTLRTTLAVYKVREPNPYSTGTVNILQRYYLTFPVARAVADCESLFIYKGWGYIITKRPVLGQVSVFRFPLAYNSSIPYALNLVTKFPMAYDVTGADLSRDKTRLALITEGGAYCYYINGDITALKTMTPIFTLFPHGSTEGACFAGNGLLVSAETRELFLFNAPAFQSW
jgi:hypothetical protein